MGSSRIKIVLPQDKLTILGHRLFYHSLYSHSFTSASGV